MSGFQELRPINRSRFSVAGVGGLCLAAITAATLTKAQEPAPDPAFEVASVKLLERRQPAPSRIDGGRVSYPFITLSALILEAYSINRYQLDGPAWLGSTRYEVIAKIPDGGDPGQVPAMLRRLLRDRFGLAVHQESRSQPVYVLLVGPNGPKLKKAEPLPPENGSAKRPAPMLSISSSGSLVLRRANLGRLAEVLSASLGAPVLDETGIDGEYDIELKVDPAEFGGLRIAVDANGAPIPAEAAAPTISPQLRALGLRLATRRALIQHLVIDRLERVPTPN